MENDITASRDVEEPDSQIDRSGQNHATEKTDEETHAGGGGEAKKIKVLVSHAGLPQSLCSLKGVRTSL